MVPYALMTRVILVALMISVTGSGIVAALITERWQQKLRMEIFLKSQPFPVLKPIFMNN